MCKTCKGKDWIYRNASSTGPGRWVTILVRCPECQKEANALKGGKE